MPLVAWRTYKVAYGKPFMAVHRDCIWTIIPYWNLNLTGILNLNSTLKESAFRVTVEMYRKKYMKFALILFVEHSDT